MSIDADSIPHYAPPTWDELSEHEKEPTCGDCRYCKDLERTQNGLTEYIAVCVFEIVNAESFADPDEVQLTCVDLDMPACVDFEARP